jgi:hypothetical protein
VTASLTTRETGYNCTKADTFNDEGFYKSSIAVTVVSMRASATLGLHFETESKSGKKNGNKSF